MPKTWLENALGRADQARGILARQIPRAVSGRLTLPLDAPGLLAPPVDHQVIERQNRVAEHHARAGVAHHGADLLPPGGLVAVDRALGAGGLVLLERALRQPQAGVAQQLGAVGAQHRATRAVLALAVDADHRLDGAGFAAHARVIAGEFDGGHGMVARVVGIGYWEFRFRQKL